MNWVILAYGLCIGTLAAYAISLRRRRALVECSVERVRAERDSPEAE